MDILNKDLIFNYIEQPYPIWIIDDFLKDDVIKKILNEWPDKEDPRWHKGHEYIDGKINILENKMRGISKLELMPEYIRSITEYFHSQEFANHIGNLIKINDLICDKSMRWSGMRTMLPDSYQLIHSDARKNPESGLRKELTCLLYLNPSYIRDRDEGCLEIWNDEMTIKTHDIEPILNRMTIFLNSDTSYHGVPIVKSERKAITFSILKDGSKTERHKALFVKRPQDSDEVKIEGIKRSIISDKK